MLHRFIQYNLDLEYRTSVPIRMKQTKAFEILVQMTHSLVGDEPSLLAWLLRHTSRPKQHFSTKWAHQNMYFLWFFRNYPQVWSGIESYITRSVVLAFKLALIIFFHSEKLFTRASDLNISTPIFVQVLKEAHSEAMSHCPFWQIFAHCFGFASHIAINNNPTMKCLECPEDTKKYKCPRCEHFW